MAVTDSPAGGLAAAARGATHLLLRMPGADARRQYEALSMLVRTAPIPVLIRGRADLALAAGAAGVNLPEADLDLAGARSLLGPDRLLGRSVHSVRAASEAAAAGADFVLFGPVFATPTHRGVAGLGLTALSEAVRAAAIPVLAIGGIDAERGEECLQAGAGGYAAIRLFWGSVVR
jgi:thiamine-phosphate diphosphorylase